MHKFHPSLLSHRTQREVEEEREKQHRESVSFYEETFSGHGPYRGNLYFDAGNNLSGKTALFKARLS